MVLSVRRDATATPRFALADRERDTTPRGGSGSRVFPRPNVAPAPARPDPDRDGDSDETSDNSLASTVSDDTDDSGDPNTGFSDGFLRSQLPGTDARKKQHLWNAVAETGRHASAARTPTPEPDGAPSNATIAAATTNTLFLPVDIATVESATGPARPESPEAPRRRPLDGGDGDSCAPTPAGRRPSGAAANRRGVIVPRESRGVPARSHGNGIGNKGNGKRGRHPSPSSLRPSPSSPSPPRRGLPPPPLRARVEGVESDAYVPGVGVRGCATPSDAFTIHGTFAHGVASGLQKVTADPFAFKSRECGSWSRRGACSRGRACVDAHGREQLRGANELGGTFDAKRTGHVARHVARAETHLTLCWAHGNAVWVDQFADAYEWVNGKPLVTPANATGVAEYLRDVMEPRTAQMYRRVDPRTGRERLAVTLGLADGLAERIREHEWTCRECGEVNPRHIKIFCHACKAKRPW
jgi:hypothetical protein